MNQLGTNTPAGFLPTEPRMGDIFERLNLLKNGYEGLKNTGSATHLAEQVERPENELKRSYARFYHGTAHAQDMQAIIEDLLNQTLRRASMPYQKGQSLEEYAAYGLARDGQNAIVIYMLKMMQDGMDLPAPKEKKRQKK
jgi:hypothetical protein